MWRKVTVTGTCPTPRAWHSAVAISPIEILIFAGMAGAVTFNDTYIFDICKYNFVVELILQASFGWRRVATTGTSPSTRQGHSAVVIEDKMYVFGGCNTERLNDLWILELGMIQFHIVAIRVCFCF